MAAVSARRPIPALVFLLALLLLSALVWWRVLNRDDSSATSAPSTTRTCVATTSHAVALPKPTTVSVSVVNATSTIGLAKKVSDALHARGFKIGANPDNDTTTSTAVQVRFGTKAAAAARLVQIYLPGSKLVPNTGTSTTVVVSVGSSYKALATAAQVTAASKTKATVKTC